MDNQNIKQYPNTNTVIPCHCGLPAMKYTRYFEEPSESDPDYCPFCDFCQNCDEFIDKDMTRCERCDDSIRSQIYATKIAGKEIVMTRQKARAKARQVMYDEIRRKDPNLPEHKINRLLEQIGL